MRHPLATLLATALLLALPILAAEPPRPSLVILLAIDQLPTSRIDPTLPGALGFLAREGAWFVDASVDHAFTETCPGHATMLTGRFPGNAGIPTNLFFDDKTGESRYCAESPADPHDHEALRSAWRRAGVLGREAPATHDPAFLDSTRSPELLHAETVADWMRAAGRGDRLFALAGKDRAAIMLGGKRPAGAFWFDERTGKFTTSRYYLAELPAWLKRINGHHPLVDGSLAALPATWSYGSEQPGAVPDDTPGEATRFSRVSPHPLRDKSLAESVARLVRTPWLDRLTLRVAEELVRAEQLGRGTASDLLAISLSGTDYIGHYYGPDSAEAVVALRELDRDLARFLSAVAQQVAVERLVVVLTSDHGVMPVPELLDSQRLGVCPAGASGRIDAAGWRQRAEAAARVICPSIDGQRLSWDENFGYRVRSVVEQACPGATKTIIRRLVELGTKEPGVVKVWTRDDLRATAAVDPLTRLYRNSFDVAHPGRNFDIALQFMPWCLFTPFPDGTSHGSPYPYDRQVPLIFWSVALKGGLRRGAARTVDIAPTLLPLMQLPTPSGLDGVALPLPPSPDRARRAAAVKSWLQQMRPAASPKR